MGHCSCCAHTHECAPEKHIEKQESIFSEYWKVGLSFILLISGIVMNALDFTFFREGYFSLIWYIVAYLPVGLPVMKEAWESIKDKDYFSEFTLMFIATLGAFYIGEYPEGVAVMLFYSIGELFQEKAVDRAKRNIGALLDVRPEEAAVVRENGVVVENPKKVKVGETIEIKTGGRVPLDGMMLNDVAAFNTSALTGESVPRSIRKNEEVLAGMIVTDKVIRIRVTRPFDKSALARILELVQNASERKAPAELFIRKFARVYTPIVTGLAVLIVLLPFLYSLISPPFVFAFNDWLYRALVFLVISCPCALVVSIPLGYFGGIGAASRLGILFKGGNYLDAITKINTVVFDKTGTLTKGEFKVAQIQPQGMTETELLEIAALGEGYSTHPIANSIREAYGKTPDMKRTENANEIAGHGISITVDNKAVLIGNEKLMKKEGIAYTPCQSGGTVVYVACDGKFAGTLVISDTVKYGAKEAISAMKQVGVKKCVMLTGDRKEAAMEVAKELGFSEDVKVVAGAGDNAAAAVGTGTVGDGQCNISLGTSGTIFISSKNFGVDENNALHSFCHADGSYHLMGCMLSAASCNKWWAEEILQTKDFAAEQAPIQKLGENNVFFLPYLMGERSPHNNPDARGVFFGMSMDTTRADMTQAVLEGVAFGLRDSLEVARKLGIKIERTKICGGGAKSPLWKKIIANVMNLKVDVLDVEEGPSMGGAMLAAVGCGAYPDVETIGKKMAHVVDTVEPEEELVAKYEEKYQKFKKLYPALKPLF